jgi:poly(3-hydroxybutyrate) depolymerase
MPPSASAIAPCEPTRSDPTAARWIFEYAFGQDFGEMTATDGRRRRLSLGVAGRPQLAAIMLLVAFAWLGGCAPLMSAPASQLPRVAGHAAASGGSPGADQPIGAELGVHASGSTSVPIRLPSGRSYALHVPKSDDGRPRPLVIALHGMLLSWQNMAWTTGLSQYADQHDFLVAYATGVGAGWDVDGRCCAQPRHRRVDDVGYLVSVVSDVASRIAVDRSRIYLVGFSAGESMALRAQCARPDVFAASAGSSGAALVPCRVRQPVRALHLHGRLDRTVPYRGGYSPMLDEHVTPAREFAARLLRQDPNAVAAVRTVPCGHLWPRLDNACRLDATDVIWRWLAQFTR